MLVDVVSGGGLNKPDLLGHSTGYFPWQSRRAWGERSILQVVWDSLTKPALRPGTHCDFGEPQGPGEQLWLDL